MYANAKTAGYANAAVDSNLLQAAAAQKYACDTVAPRAPVFARLGKLSEEILSVTRANLAAANRAADALGGATPENDACGEDSLPNGMLEQLERHLQTVLSVAMSTSGAISRIERLF